MKLFIGLWLIVFSLWLGAGVVFARVTPEDIVNLQKQAYQVKVKNYSSSHQQKLDNLVGKIALVNKTRTDELNQIMKIQAAILDECQQRSTEKNQEEVEKARYWITFAHEAVAYQQAKIYIFGLSSEANIKNDVLEAVNLFWGELNSTRGKVIYSQNILEELVK